MPYKDPERARIAALEANRRYRQRLHDARFGVGVGDMRGRLGGPARMGPAHPRWNGGVMRTSHGYIGLKVPKGHHLRQAHGYAYEHKLVAERMLGRRLMPGEVVHHKNRDRADNRPENLVVLMNGDHVRLHKTKHYSALLLGEQGRLLDELDRAPGDDQGGRELWQTGSRPRLLRSITDTPAVCQACEWQGTAGECEPDVDGDGSLGCPGCRRIVICQGDSEAPPERPTWD